MSPEDIDPDAVFMVTPYREWLIPADKMDLFVQVAIPVNAKWTEDGGKRVIDKVYHISDISMGVIKGEEILAYYARKKLEVK